MNLQNFYKFGSFLSGFGKITGKASRSALTAFQDIGCGEWLPCNIKNKEKPVFFLTACFCLNKLYYFCSVVADFLRISAITLRIFREYPQSI
jgi:hypothetical protein